MKKPFVALCNIKYKEYSILPWHLSYEGNPDWLFGCIGGEVVKMEYLAKYDIDKAEDMESLNEVCKELFGMEFNIMMAVWAKRRPDLPLKVWYKVKMHLQ